MKRKNNRYNIYLVSILVITVLLSLAILNIRKTGGFVFSIKSTNDGILVEELKKINEMEKFNDHENYNSLRYHDIEWQIEKPRGTYRIIALGDSMTDGLAVSVESTWPKQLEKKLNNGSKNINFEVMNMGKVDCGTFEEVETFIDVGSQYNPDMIILQYYPRDWVSPEVRVKGIELWEKYVNGKYRLETELEKTIESINADERAISSIIHRIVYQEYLDKTDWEKEWDTFVKEPLIKLIGVVDSENIDMIVITWDIGANEKLEKIKLTSLLSEHKIPFYDFSEKLSSDSCPSLTRLPDCHLTSVGYGVVAENLLHILND